jgi:transcriptional regulator with XRE-family HTH domain
MQKELAALVKVSPRSQQSYEQDRSSPDAATLVAYAALGVDVQFVLTGTPLPGEMSETYKRAAIATLKVIDRDLAESYVRSFPGVEEESGRRRYDNTPKVYVLSAEESKLIEDYRSSDDDGRKALRQTSAAIAKKPR